MSRRRALLTALGVGITAMISSQPLLATDYTWDGDTGNDMANPANWVGDVAPPDWGADTTSLIFPGGLATGASLTPTLATGYQYFTSVLFTADAPTYSILGNGLETEFKNTDGIAINNESSNYQVIDVSGARFWEKGYIKATNGDIVINGGIAVGSLDNSNSAWTGVSGPYNIYFNVDPVFHTGGNLAGGAWTNRYPSANTNMYGWGQARFFMDELAGTAYLGDIGATYWGTFHVNSYMNGALRLTNDYSLGAAANSGRQRYTAVVIWGGNSDDPDPEIAQYACNGTLELDGSASSTGGISVTRGLLFLDGRQGTARGVGDDPHILNVAGNNTLTTLYDWNTGMVGAGAGADTPGNINIQSDSGTLTIEGGPMYNTTSQIRTLVLAGAGNGVINARVTNYNAPANPGISLVKKGTGTWTLTNIDNDYLGTTTVDQGTLLAAGPHDGGGAYTVNAAGTLAGVGPISAAVDLSGTLSPGNPVGTMNLSGGLVVHTGATLAVDLESELSLTDDWIYADTLNIADATSISVKVTAVGGSTLPDGHYVLASGYTLVAGATPAINYTGPLASGQTARLTVVPEYKALYLTLGNPSWQPPLPPPPPPKPVWTGLAPGGDNSMTNGANWLAGTVPDLSATSRETLVFPELTPGANTAPTLTADTFARRILITATSTAYTFTGPYKLQLNVGGGNDSVLNLSTATQTFSVGSFAAPGSTVRADSGDIVMNTALDTAGGLTFAGNAHNVYFNVSSDILPGNVPGAPWVTIEPVDAAYDDGVWLQGDLTVYLGDIGSLWTGVIVAQNNVQVIPTHVNAFGSYGDYGATEGGGVSAGGRTRMESGTAVVKLTDATPAVMADILNVVPRSGATAAAPHLLNVSGDHEWDGFLQNYNTTGTYVNVVVESGSLKLAGTIQNPQNSLKTFRLVAYPGATGEVFNAGFQCSSSTTRTWNVSVEGGGVWTNSSALNNYRGWTWVTPGNTYIFNGTHQPDAEYVIPSYEIDGLLRGTGTIKTTVIVAANGDPTGVVAPGTDAAPGTLTVGSLAINPGGTLKYRFSTPGSTNADLIVADTLDLSTTTTFNVEVTSLSGPTLPTGEYLLVDYTNIVPPAGLLSIHYTGPLAPDQEAGLRFDQPTGRMYLVIGHPPPFTLPVDFDQNGDVDALDYQALSGCFSGPAVPYAEGCIDKDIDVDGDVDQDDFAKWQWCFTGTGFQAPIPDCTHTAMPTYP